MEPEVSPPKESNEGGCAMGFCHNSRISFPKSSAFPLLDTYRKKIVDLKIDHYILPDRHVICGACQTRICRAVKDWKEETFF